MEEAKFLFCGELVREINKHKCDINEIEIYYKNCDNTISFKQFNIEQDKMRNVYVIY